MNIDSESFNIFLSIATFSDCDLYSVRPVIAVKFDLNVRRDCLKSNRNVDDNVIPRKIATRVSILSPTRVQNGIEGAIDTTKRK